MKGCGVAAPVRIVVVTTSASTLRAFFAAQVDLLRDKGFEVNTVSSPDLALIESGLPDHPIPMNRAISPMADLLPLVRLIRLIRRIRPQIVHAHTPKAGLLGMISAWIANTPIRVYSVHGLVWITKDGLLRRLLMSAEQLACMLATNVISVSPSVRHEILRFGVCDAGKVRVLGAGSNHGVDTVRFSPKSTPLMREEARRGLAIPTNAQVILFVGRIVREKGIKELADAWRKISTEKAEAHLLICGETETRDAVDADILEEMRAHPRVQFTSSVPAEMPRIYAAADLVVLPTWREGLPGVLLEAGAMELPVVATRVTGCVDAVIDGLTGVLIAPRDPGALAQAISDLLDDPGRMRSMGERARQFVCEKFSSEDVSVRLAVEYRRLLAEAGL